METGIQINSKKNGKKVNLKGQNGILYIKIKKILSLHTLADESWIKAVSAQYFLIGIAEIFGFNAEKNQDYAAVLEESFSSIKLSHKGGFKIEEKNILIIPDENTKLLECMRQEDVQDGYYLKTRLRAELINKPELIYKNYQYGLMVRISSACNSHIFNAVQAVAIDELFTREAIDPYGGWYHYRLPWVTARILISLKSAKLDNRNDEENIKKVISDALKSLIDRIDSKGYWRSGAGDWVSKWESTGLCLEAIYFYDQIEDNKEIIDGVIDYLLSEESRKEWLGEPSFADEQSANETLASVILASVLYRIIGKHYASYDIKIQESIEQFFLKCLDIIEKGEDEIVRQYCTIPEILYYIAIAMKGA